MTSATVPCRLVLQVPGANVRRSFVVAASDDHAAIRTFAVQMLNQAQDAIDRAPDVFAREFAVIEMEQLKARLSWAIGEAMPPSDAMTT